MTSSPYASPVTPDSTPEEEFRARVQLALGISYEDAITLAEAQEERRHERLVAAGYCCEAGALWHPDACPTHKRHRVEP
jgi:hypothetical protein